MWENEVEVVTNREVMVKFKFYFYFFQGIGLSSHQTATYSVLEEFVEF